MKKLIVIIAGLTFGLSLMATPLGVSFLNKGKQDIIVRITKGNTPDNTIRYQTIVQGGQLTVQNDIPANIPDKSVYIWARKLKEKNFKLLTHYKVTGAALIGFEITPELTLSNAKEVDEYRNVTFSPLQGGSNLGITPKDILGTEKLSETALSPKDKKLKLQQSQTDLSAKKRCEENKQSQKVIRK